MKNTADGADDDDGEGHGPSAAADHLCRMRLPPAEISWIWIGHILCGLPDAADDIS